VNAQLREDHNGVILDYGDPAKKYGYHEDTSPKAGDRERQALVRQRDALVEAERRVRTVQIAIANICSDAAGYVRGWLDDELDQIQADLLVIRRSMNTTRDRLGMAEVEL
jgi:hypothetical protein